MLETMNIIEQFILVSVIDSFRTGTWYVYLVLLAELYKYSECLYSKWSSTSINLAVYSASLYGTSTCFYFHDARKLHFPAIAF